MATLIVNIQDLTTRMATQCKTLKTLINNNATDLSALTTTAKTNLVAAINELDAAIDAINAGGAGVQIDDASTTSTVDTWSCSKIVSAIATAVSQLVDSSPDALNTLNELAAALGDDANFASTINTALANRVRFDAAQTLTTGQKTQACTNLGIGEPDTDFVALFNSAL